MAENDGDRSKLIGFILAQCLLVLLNAYQAIDPVAIWIRRDVNRWSYESKKTTWR
ncbi:MAG: hypothetical protein WBA43_22870 [Elainellaceae cyanobacterium]